MMLATFAWNSQQVLLCKLQPGVALITTARNLERNICCAKSCENILPVLFGPCVLRASPRGGGGGVG